MYVLLNENKICGKPNNYLFLLQYVVVDRALKEGHLKLRRNTPFKYQEALRFNITNIPFFPIFAGIFILTQNSLE